MKKDYIETIENNFITSYTDFANRLNYAMVIRDINNLKLAKSIYVSPSAISSYRKGTRQPNFTVLRSIALALEVSTDFLLGLSDYMDFSKTCPYENAEVTLPQK